MKMPFLIRVMVGILPAGMALLFGCASRSQQSDLLTLSLADEAIIDVAGLETDNIYDPLNLLKRGEAYRVKKDYVAASEEYHRFLELYPFHRMASFAQYSLGLCYYNLVRSIDRDPSPVEQALVAFNKVLTDYPESLYVNEAASKIGELTEKQARHEFSIGHFYYKQKIYPAAIARFGNALKKAGGGEVREKILYYMGLSHYWSGDREKAESVLQSLREEYPDSPYIRQNKIPL